jgi:hypothetical protein
MTAPFTMPEFMPAPVVPEDVKVLGGEWSMAYDMLARSQRACSSKEKAAVCEYVRMGHSARDIPQPRWEDMEVHGRKARSLYLTTIAAGMAAPANEYLKLIGEINEVGLPLRDAFSMSMSATGIEALRTEIRRRKHRQVEFSV